MKNKINVKLKHFHRSQIGRAQRYIRNNSFSNLRLKNIAKEVGSSEYHFGRLFLSYTGETVFTYLRRIRLLNALNMLQEDNECSITEVALSVGYETHSAFNKVFKSILKINPSQFRYLEKKEQDNIVFSQSTSPKEIEILINITVKPEIVTRESIQFLYVEKAGIFKEVAMPTWYELLPLIDKNIPAETITEYLGFSTMDSNSNDETKMYYMAGVAVTKKPVKIPRGLKLKTISGGTYAKFVLIGPTHLVWPAFDKIFKILAERKIKLRTGSCIENYLSNPELVPENELVTELFVPVDC